MAPPSALEQACVIKGGFGCIVGNSLHGYHFDLIILDFLLDKIVQSLRYEEVICICLDRSLSAFDEYTKAHSKLRIIHVVQDSLLQQLDSVLDSLQSSGNVDKTAILIYSFSEIALVLGDDVAMNYLLRLQSLSLGSCLLAVKGSLHEARYLHRIQAECPVVVCVERNMGMYQENVLCEVSVLRKSKNTGKVSEEYDLFVRSDGQNGITALQHKEEIVVEKEDTSTAPQTLSDLSSGKATETPSENTVDIAPIKNLVLFDRTDPEFDEDSDPDADLDL